MPGFVSLGAGVYDPTTQRRPGNGSWWVVAAKRKAYAMADVNTNSNVSTDNTSDKYRRVYRVPITEVNNLPEWAKAALVDDLAPADMKSPGPGVRYFAIHAWMDSPDGTRQPAIIAFYRNLSTELDMARVTPQGIWRPTQVEAKRPAAPKKARKVSK
jgi:hypothetical protein